MHEHSFIEAILNNIENKDNVIGISLEVGELAGIEASHLIEHLKKHVDWKIQVVGKKSNVKCVCGYLGKANIRQRLHDLVIFNCPKCGNNVDVLEGKDIKILKITYK
jgi:Zn finger protein HypA/HybF involved in hydrogenase expression